jgi:hypothetical protein
MESEKVSIVYVEYRPESLGSPTADSRVTFYGSTLESPGRSSDGLAVLSISIANKDESLLCAI